MMMSILTKTTLVSLVDDPAVNNTFSEFLLQVQGGLPQGSRQTGLAVPRGNILMTSNEKETERYIYIASLLLIHLGAKIICCKKSYI